MTQNEDDAEHLTKVRDNLGLSHARMVNAAQGKPMGTEIFLTLCRWMNQDPLWYCEEATKDDLTDKERSRENSTRN